MDRDLVTRILISCALVAAFLAASITGFHVGFVGPVAVIGIAVVMFWPRHADDDAQLSDGRQGT